MSRLVQNSMRKSGRVRYKTATDGAHVQIVNGGNEWYIVPLCHGCNTQFGANNYVNGPLVPVNPIYPIKW